MIGMTSILARFPWRLQRRSVVGRRTRVLSGIGAVALALVVSGIAIEISGLSALQLGRRAVESILGTSYGLQQALVLATPLMLTGLAVALAAKMGLWNIGIEGQLFMGGWAAAGVGLYVNAPDYLMLPLMFMAGAVAGALWVLIPAVARAWWGANEILTTLMLNSVAIYWVNHFVMGPWRDLVGAVLTATPRVPFEIPHLVGTLHAGILIPLVISVVIWLAVRGTRWGYEISIIGGNRRAAEFAGIPVRRQILVTMLLSGAIAGVAGMVEVAGTTHRLSGTISNGYGYLGIVVSALAGTSALAIPTIGFLLACLLNAGIVLQTQGLSLHTMLAINGVILMFAAVGEVAAQYQWVRVRPAGKREAIKAVTDGRPPASQRDSVNF